MGKYLFFACFCTAMVFVISFRMAERNDMERKQLRSEVRMLMDDIDDGGDMDKYCGSDHFEALHDFAYAK